jgi:hypothetical protein
MLQIDKNQQTQEDLRSEVKDKSKYLLTNSINKNV